jgi:hypothetical protein
MNFNFVAIPPCVEVKAAKFKISKDITTLANSKFTKASQKYTSHSRAQPWYCAEANSEYFEHYIIFTL